MEIHGKINDVAGSLLGRPLEPQETARVELAMDHHELDMLRGEAQPPDAKTIESLRPLNEHVKIDGEF